MPVYIDVDRYGQRKNKHKVLSSDKSIYADQLNLVAETGPIFGDDDGVAGIGGIVFDGGRQADATGVKIDHVAEVGDILRGFVADASHVVLVDEQLQFTRAVRLQLSDINDSTVSNATGIADAQATLLFALLRSFPVTAHPGNHGE